MWPYEHKNFYPDWSIPFLLGNSCGLFRKQWNFRVFYEWINLNCIFLPALSCFKDGPYNFLNKFKGALLVTSLGLKSWSWVMHNGSSSEKSHQLKPGVLQESALAANHHQKDLSESNPSLFYCRALLGHYLWKSILKSDRCFQLAELCTVAGTKELQCCCGFCGVCW